MLPAPQAAFSSSVTVRVSNFLAVSLEAVRTVTVAGEVGRRELDGPGGGRKEQEVTGRSRKRHIGPGGG